MLGVDTDPIAVEATTANAARNRLARRIRAREGSLPSAEPPFDMVLANLIASILITLAPGLGLPPEVPCNNASRYSFLSAILFCASAVSGGIRPSGGSMIIDVRRPVRRCDVKTAAL